MLASCATKGTSNAPITLQFQQEVFLSDGQRSKEPKKKFETFALEGKPVLVESPGYTSVFVVPPQKGVGVVDIKLKPMDDFGGPFPATSMDIALNEVVNGIQEVHLLLSFNRVDEAIAKADVLGGLYPRLIHVKLLRASCYVLKNQRDKALPLLESALEEYPNNKVAQDLYRSLISSKEKTAGDRAPAEAPSLLDSVVVDDKEETKKSKK